MVLSFLKRTYELWREDNAPHIAAALTYYILLSTAPLLAVLVGVLGEYLGRSLVADQIISQANALAGPLGEDVIRELIRTAAPAASGRAISVVAGVLAVLGAMRVFGELRTAFNNMWEVPPDETPEGDIWAQVRWWVSQQGREKLKAFAMLAVVGLLFVASLLASAAFSVLANVVPPLFAIGPGVIRVLDSAVSILLVTALFAIVYRYLPRTRIAWRDVIVGAAATAVLFVLGRLGLGLYFTYATPGSAYGAAGSLVALLLWANLSIQLALFGAEFTYLWAHERGSKQDEPTRRPARSRKEARARAAAGTRKARTA